MIYVLKLNDISRLELENLCINCVMVRFPKSLTISSKIFPIFIHTKPGSLTTKIVLCKESVKILEKKVFLIEGLLSGKKSNRV